MAFPSSLSQSNPFGYEEEEEISGGWGAPAPKKSSTGDILKDAMKKEAVIKYVTPLVCLHGLTIGRRDIMATQEDLRSG